MGHMIGLLFFSFLERYSVILFIIFIFSEKNQSAVLPNGEALDLNRVPDPTCDNTENNCMAHEPLKRSHGTYDWAFFCHFSKRKVILFIIFIFIFSEKKISQQCCQMVRPWTLTGSLIQHVTTRETIAWTMNP